jgi:hypothetical protein
MIAALSAPKIMRHQQHLGSLCDSLFLLIAVASLPMKKSLFAAGWHLLRQLTSAAHLG